MVPELTIDIIYRYKVIRQMEGGMGCVFLLDKLIDNPLLPSGAMPSKFLQEKFRYPYRETLAAKTVKDINDMALFYRECGLWLDLDHPGIVPLLKVVSINNKVYALMPVYKSSLRSLIERRDYEPINLLKSLKVSIEGLDFAHRKLRLIHQDIKPENFLIDTGGGNFQIALSDWGIANVQNARLQSQIGGPSQQTMAGFGTLPYMAPERFLKFISDSKSDVFSLGMMMTEILSGELPFVKQVSIASQIASGQYYSNARSLLGNWPSKISDFVLLMINPAAKRRPDNCKSIIKFLNNL